MSGEKSQRKGAASEREIVRLFRCWWGGEPWRRSGIGFEGHDVIGPDDFPWAVEVKNWREARTDWLFADNQTLSRWWLQTVNQAPDTLQPLLCLKIEGRWFVLVEKQYVPSWIELEVKLERQIACRGTLITTLDSFLHGFEPHIDRIRRISTNAQEVLSEMPHVRSTVHPCPARTSPYRLLPPMRICGGAGAGVRKAADRPKKGQRPAYSASLPR